MLVMFVKVIQWLRKESLFCPQLTYSNSSPKKKKKNPTYSNKSSNLKSVS